MSTFPQQQGYSQVIVQQFEPETLLVGEEDNMNSYSREEMPETAISPSLERCLAATTPFFEGQSVGIAVCKLIGTVFASLAFYLYADISQDSILLPFCYIAIFIYDLTYVSLLIKQQRSKIDRDMTRAEIL